MNELCCLTTDMITNKLNIVLIDDHQLLVQSLSDLLYKYDFIKSVCVYSHPQDYFASAQPEPDIIISEIAIPGINSIDLLAQYKQTHTKAKLILLTSIVEVQTIRYSLRNGANGYLGKDASSDELVNAIITVYSNKPYIAENLRHSFLSTTIAEEQHACNLSQREKQVLKFVCEGNTIKEAAYEMQLSINTVQGYYKTILKKFNMNRTADLIVFAIQHGLYTPSKKSG